MQVVYDKQTQQQIDKITSCIQEIQLESTTKLTASSMNEFERQRQINPNYHPVYDNPECKFLTKQLENIYTYAVPKYILAGDEAVQFMKNRQERS
jgi:hypothetical protein